MTIYIGLPDIPGQEQKTVSEALIKELKKYYTSSEEDQVIFFLEKNEISVYITDKTDALESDVEPLVRTILKQSFPDWELKTFKSGSQKSAGQSRKKRSIRYSFIREIWKILTLSPISFTYWKIVKNYVKMTIKWLKDKVKEKLKDKINGKVLLSEVSVLKNAVLEVAEKNQISLEEVEETVNVLERIEREHFKNMMVDMDESGNLGIWEAVLDETEQIVMLKGDYGFATIVQ